MKAYKQSEKLTENSKHKDLIYQQPIGKRDINGQLHMPTLVVMKEMNSKQKDESIFGLLYWAILKIPALARLYGKVGSS